MARFRRLGDLNVPPVFVDPRWQYLLPEAPTAVTAVAGNAQAVVSWTAPASIADITDYYVQFQPSGGGWSTFSDGVSASTSATVTGLNNGTSYAFRVAAVSGIGQGPWSAASGAVTPIAGDPYFGNVSLLLHGDGNLTDSSSYGHAVTAFGNAAATGGAKYGSASLTFDGSGDYLTIPSSTAFDLPGDFTIEAWVRLAAPPGVFGGAYGAAIIGRYQAPAADQGWQLRVNGTSSGYDTINVYTGQTDLNWSASISQNTWHHIAVSRSGSSIRAFLNGTQVGSTVTNSDPFTPSSSRTLSVGRLALETTFLFDIDGQIDDLRITKGIARYTANFTPPTAAFPDA